MSRAGGRRNAERTSHGHPHHGLPARHVVFPKPMAEWRLSRRIDESREVARGRRHGPVISPSPAPIPSATTALDSAAGGGWRGPAPWARSQACSPPRWLPHCRWRARDRMACCRSCGTHRVHRGPGGSSRPSRSHLASRAGLPAEGPQMKAPKLVTADQLASIPRRRPAVTRMTAVPPPHHRLQAIRSEAWSRLIIGVARHARAHETCADKLVPTAKNSGRTVALVHTASRSPRVACEEHRISTVDATGRKGTGSHEQ